ncbi:MAG TPA: glycoside hydrolase family 97 C-terminal domain-containing protein, partial [Pyrinomonadaceae bacterium]|jgi:alpha-glucosidase|nr:glycoside hydrolase family 97 C-terminal domain-containing protein [Pyrinomonadaceae bacterium]
MIKSIPSTWDETIALPPSEIGELAVFARRKGRVWFIAVLNGSKARSMQIPLTFLGRGEMESMLVRDKLDDPAAIEIEHSRAANRNALNLDMRAAGGFIARFRPATDAARRS